MNINPQMKWIMLMVPLQASGDWRGRADFILYRKSKQRPPWLLWDVGAVSHSPWKCASMVSMAKTRVVISTGLCTRKEISQRASEKLLTISWFYFNGIRSQLELTGHSREQLNFCGDRSRIMRISILCSFVFFCCLSASMDGWLVLPLVHLELGPAKKIQITM